VPALDGKLGGGGAWKGTIRNDPPTVIQAPQLIIQTLNGAQDINVPEHMAIEDKLHWCMEPKVSKLKRKSKSSLRVSDKKK
jgi:hypothetical protein